MADGDPRHVYNDEVAGEILERISAGESLTRICADADMPCRRTVLRWQDGGSGAPENFCLRYARAVQDRAEMMFDEVCDLADGAAVAADALGEEAQDSAPSGCGAEAYRRVYKEEINARRLRIDSRKWALGRMNRSKYGDKSTVALEGGVEDSVPIKVKHVASLEDMTEALRLVQELSNDGGE